MIAKPMWYTIEGASEAIMGRETAPGAFKKEVEVDCGRAFPYAVFAQINGKLDAVDIKQQTLNNRARNQGLDAKSDIRRP